MKEIITAEERAWRAQFSGPKELNNALMVRLLDEMGIEPVGELDEIWYVKMSRMWNDYPFPELMKILLLAAEVRPDADELSPDGIVRSSAQVLLDDDRYADFSEACYRVNRACSLSFTHPVELMVVGIELVMLYAFYHEIPVPVEDFVQIDFKAALDATNETLEFMLNYIKAEGSDDRESLPFIWQYRLQYTHSGI